MFNWVGYLPTRTSGLHGMLEGDHLIHLLLWNLWAPALVHVSVVSRYTKCNKEHIFKGYITVENDQHTSMNDDVPELPNRTAKQ